MLFAVLTTVSFFVVVEGILSAFDVRPQLYDDDPYVGFASNVPLFIEGKGGKMVTAPNKVRWFNGQEFAKRKPKGTTRIFCLGGSTTYGRPYDDGTSFCGWLREYLPAADSSVEWEVINAGGISYASYRVAKLMEELASYSPDLFVIYSGHNEFLEERTYAEIINAPSAVRGMQTALGHTRIYGLMTRFLGSKSASHQTKPPVLPGEVKTILDQSAGLDRYSRDAELSAEIIAHYRYNLARMVNIAEAAGANVIFVTPAANLRNSSPFKSEHANGLTAMQIQQWEVHWKSAQKSYAAARYDDAHRAINLAIAVDEAYAHSHYLRGQILQELGRSKEALTAYELALENDICPLRILPEMRSILAETASTRNTPLFDYQAFLAKRSEHGIPGDDWFLDHVHPTVEGHRLLALELVSLMEQHGQLSNKSTLNEASIEQIKQRVLAGIDDNAHGIALRNLGNVLSWAGKKREAYTAVTRALALAPGDAYAHYLAGDLARYFGNASEAEARFRELIRFNLDPIDAPYFPDAHYQLAQILSVRGVTSESVRLLSKTLQLEPDHEAAKEALPHVLETHGKLLLQQGRNAEAEAAFRQVEKLSSSHSNATNLLGVALIQAEKFTEAIEVLKRAASKDERNPSVHNNLGSAYARSNQTTPAARHFKLAIQSNPAHAGAHLNLARLLESTGQRKQAAAHYRSVLQLSPNSEEARAGLARTEPLQH